MRWIAVVVATFGLGGALVALGTPVAPADAPAAYAQPRDTATPTSGPTPPPETPVVDPDPPLPRPIFLAWVARRESSAQPPPVVAGALGYVAALNARGRAACTPGTHVLLEGREGARDNRVVAVVYQAASDAALTLDLYVGDLVQVTGLESSTAPACRDVVTTARLIGVRTLERVVRPPGG